MTKTYTYQEVLETYPESILVEEGARIVAKRKNEYQARRPFLPEPILRGMAREMAKTITIRTYVDGCSHDETRPATEAESDILYKLALSALLGLNHGESAREEMTAEDAIINAIEYTLLLMIPEANSYNSLYLKLRRMMENWRNHTEAELALHYGAC